MDGIFMRDTVRCPACRGSKKVPKLGGMIGECNTCSGKGTILAVDKPLKVEAVTLEDVISQELINAVANAAPVITEEEGEKIAKDYIEKRMVASDKITVEVLNPVELPEEPVLKLEGKKAVFRHKTSAK